MSRPFGSPWFNIWRRLQRSYPLDALVTSFLLHLDGSHKEVPTTRKGQEHFVPDSGGRDTCCSSVNWWFRDLEIIPRNRTVSMSALPQTIQMLFCIGQVRIVKSLWRSDILRKRSETNKEMSKIRPTQSFCGVHFIEIRPAVLDLKHAYTQTDGQG